jgi:hypothetical protein
LLLSVIGAPHAADHLKPLCGGDFSRVEHDVTDERAGEEGLDTQVLARLRRGDRRAEVGAVPPAWMMAELIEMFLKNLQLRIDVVAQLSRAILREGEYVFSF